MNACQTAPMTLTYTNIGHERTLKPYVQDNYNKRRKYTSIYWYKITHVITSVHPIIWFEISA